MAKAVKDALKQRQILRKAAGESISMNRVNRGTLANKPIRGNFSNLLKFQAKETTDKVDILKTYERPELLKKDETASPEVVSSLLTLTKEAETLKQVLSALEKAMKVYGKYNG